MPNLIETDDFIALAAFRYALGRRTYAVSLVVQWLRTNKNLLTRETRQLIVTEIRAASLSGNIGMDVDRHEWSALADEFEKVTT